jgi:hypothetical protein
VIPDAELARELFPTFKNELDWHINYLREFRHTISMIIRDDFDGKGSIYREIRKVYRPYIDTLKRIVNLLEAMALIDQHPRDARKHPKPVRELAMELASKRIAAFYTLDADEEELTLERAEADLAPLHDE